MIDSFVLVAPIYLLVVIALAGFVGCAQVVGIEEWDPQEGPPPDEPPLPLQAPTNVQGTPGDGVVTLFWDPYPDALLFEIDRKIAPTGMPPASYDFLDSVTPGELSTIDGFLAYEDHTVTNGITYHYVVRATTGDGTSENSGDIEATPKSNFGPFVTKFKAGTPRPGEDGWFGFAFVVVGLGVKVQKLGRYYRPSHDEAHEINLIDAASLQVLGTATVSLASETLDDETPDGVFRYADVKPDPVDLKVDNEYFIVSHEAALGDDSLPGDDFLTQDTLVLSTRPEAHVTNTAEGTTLTVLSPTAGGADHVYGPLNFQY